MCHESLLVWICSLYLQSQQDIEDLDDEDEVKKLAHHWSDEEFETNYTEQGYEADTEANTHDDWHKGNRVRAVDLRQLHKKSELGLNLFNLWKGSVWDTCMQGKHTETYPHGGIWGQIF